MEGDDLNPFKTEDVLEGGEKQPKENSKHGAWLTQASQAVRDKFEELDVGYKTQADVFNAFLELHNENQELKAKTPKRFSSEDYSTLDNSFKTRAEKELFNLLKEGNIDPTNISKYLDSSQKTQEEFVAETLEKQRVLETTLRENWGDKYETIKATYENTAKRLFPDTDTRNRITTKGLHLDSDFVNLIVKIGELSGENGFVVSSVISKKKELENPMGFQIA